MLVPCAGKDANYKLAKLRDWIQQQPASVPSYSKSPPTPSQIHVATLITSLSCVGVFVSESACDFTLNLASSAAYLLNLRGSDIPYNPLFQAYLFVGLDSAVIFLDQSKVNDDIAKYLKALNIERKEYVDLWPFLRRREWGDGKVRSSSCA